MTQENRKYVQRYNNEIVRKLRSQDNHYVIKMKLKTLLVTIDNFIWTIDKNL